MTAAPRSSRSRRSSPRTRTAPTAKTGVTSDHVVRYLRFIEEQGYTLSIVEQRACGTSQGRTGRLTPSWEAVAIAPAFHIACANPSAPQRSRKASPAERPTASRERCAASKETQHGMMGLWQSATSWAPTLEPCGTDPMTGFFRDGCCRTGPEDLGSHTICAVVTAEFLDHQRSIGNDLTTPRPAVPLPWIGAR